MQWYLSRLRLADIPALVANEAESLREPWGRLAFEAELDAPGARGVVARSGATGDESRVIAYICTRLVLDEMHLFRIAVAPQWRGHGIGAQLLAGCIEDAMRRGAASVLIEVRPSNRAALALYRKFGFEVTAVRPGYYPGSREDALMLRKSLGRPNESEPKKEEA